MITSMTGFASLTRDHAQATIGVTLRSVNHRYLDLQLRLPPAFTDLEPRVRSQMQRRVARGRIEVIVTVQWRQQPSIEVELNESFVSALTTALSVARTRGLVDGALTPGDLLRFPQALTVRERPLDPEAGAMTAVAAGVERAVGEALDELESMRTREGRHLQADLDGRCATVGSLVEHIATRAREGQSSVEARLTERVKDLTRDLQFDRALIAQEIVRTAARSDISEEVVRFRAHVAQWKALADGPEPCGRKLDFLIQEMNREVNTMGAKADGVSVSELVIAAKAELEKMREQVQNVE
jgi:uncharacterized protein (TIGR00255 family)